MKVRQRLNIELLAKKFSRSTDGCGRLVFFGGEKLTLLLKLLTWLVIFLLRDRRQYGRLRLRLNIILSLSCEFQDSDKGISSVLFSRHPKIRSHPSNRNNVTQLLEYEIYASKTNVILIRNRSIIPHPH